MRTLNGHFVLRYAKVKDCCFCQRPFNHAKKTKEGKVFFCKCGASFIWPQEEENLENKIAKILQFSL